MYAVDELNNYQYIIIINVNNLHLAISTEQITNVNNIIRIINPKLNLVYIVINIITTIGLDNNIIILNTK